MPEELIMRGKTASGDTETLSFGGHTPGYAYQLTQLALWNSTNIGADNSEQMATITAGKTAINPTDPDFSNEGLIAVAKHVDTESRAYPYQDMSVINDLFYITQDLILMVIDTESPANPVNWQCKFRKVKLTDSAEAVANYNQFTIYD